MAGDVTTGWCDSARAEIVESLHDVSVNYATVGVTNTGGQATLTGIAGADIVKFRVGAAVTGTNVTAGSVVASIDSATQVTLSKTTAGAVTSCNILGDVYNILLFTAAASMSRTFARDSTNVGTPGTGAASATNVGTDEVSAVGTNYTAGGIAVTNASPTITAGSGAWWNLGANPAWASATFTSRGCCVYSTRPRVGHANGITANASGSSINKPLAMFSFTTDQSVSSGTFTVVMPGAAYGTAMFAIG